MRLPWIVAAASLISLLAANQTFGQTTSNGLFGSNTVGGSTATRTPTASSSARSSTGTSAGGTTGGTSGAGGTGTQNVAQTAQQNMVSNAAQPTQQRGFVGADSSNTVNFLSLQAANGQTGARATGNNGMSQLNNLFSQGLQQLNQQTQRAARPQIRVPLRSSFQPQPLSVAQVRRIEENINKLPAIRFIGPARLEMQDRTAVLRGVVASEDDRRLAENLAKMEPEVLAVRNELTVDSSATGSPAATGPAEALPPARTP